MLVSDENDAGQEHEDSGWGEDHLADSFGVQRKSVGYCSVGGRIESSTDNLQGDGGADPHRDGDEVDRQKGVIGEHSRRYPSGAAPRRNTV